MSEAEAKAEKIEEGELDAYMDLDEENKASAPTQQEELEYLRARKGDIDKEYKFLQLQKLEAEGAGRKEWMDKIREAFTLNFKCRKYVVRRLRALGEKVEDRFIVG